MHILKILLLASMFWSGYFAHQFLHPSEVVLHNDIFSSGGLY